LVNVCPTHRPLRADTLRYSLRHDIRHHLRGTTGPQGAGAAAPSPRHDR